MKAVGMIHPSHLQEALRHLFREASLETVLKVDIQLGTGLHSAFSKGKKEHRLNAFLMPFYKTLGNLQ